MQKNEGKLDRTLRLIIGLAVIIAGIIFNSWWGALGIIPLATSAMSWCPLYTILGISTCKFDSK